MSVSYNDDRSAILSPVTAGEKTAVFDVASAEERTAVFHPGSLTAKEPRSYDMDEPTRQLPLISGRFAGREWIVEDLEREYTEKKAAKAEKKPGRFRTAAAVLTGLAAVIVLVLALLGQAKLVALNEESAALEREIAVLREEEDRALAVTDRIVLSAEDEGPAALGAWQSGELSGNRPETDGQDVATVLNIRRGQRMNHLWRTFVDGLGASFR